MATPPTLTAPTSNNKIGDDIVVTFTDDAVWRAAVTAVKIDGVAITAAAGYVLAAGTITFDATYRTFDEARDNYALVVEATGYDDATATIEIVVNTWRLLKLYQVTPHDDLADFEEEMISQLEYEGDDYTIQHQNVKDEIKEALINFFSYKQAAIRSAEDDANLIILDYIINPNDLKRPAIFLALKNLFNSQIITPDDPWATLYSKYDRMYKKALEASKQLMRFNTTISDTYGQNYGIITMIR